MFYLGFTQKSKNIKDYLYLSLVTCDLVFCSTGNNVEGGDSID